MTIRIHWEVRLIIISLIFFAVQASAQQSVFSPSQQLRPDFACSTEAWGLSWEDVSTPSDGKNLIDVAGSWVIVEPDLLYEVIEYDGDTSERRFDGWRTNSQRAKRVSGNNQNVWIIDENDRVLRFDSNTLRFSNPSTLPNTNTGQAILARDMAPGWFIHKTQTATGGYALYRLIRGIWTQVTGSSGPIGAIRIGGYGLSISITTSSGQVLTLNGNRFVDIHSRDQMLGFDVNGTWVVGGRVNVDLTSETDGIFKQAIYVYGGNDWNRVKGKNGYAKAIGGSLEEPWIIANTRRGERVFALKRPIRPSVTNGPFFRCPKLWGAHADGCDTFGRGCGQPAADTFCRIKGYRRAVADGYTLNLRSSSKIDPMSIPANRRAYTRTPRLKELCTGQSCGSLYNVRCQE